MEKVLSKKYRVYESSKEKDLYDFKQIRVISAGVRDADAEGVEGMSASKMRKAAAENDFETFSKGVPKSLDDKTVKQLFNTVKKQMKIKEGKENIIL